jgi:hypothetical protein
LNECCGRFIHAMLAVCLLSSSASALHAQATPSATLPTPRAQVTFAFERAGLPVPRFTMNVDEHGSGTYKAEEASATDSQQIQRSIALTEATSKKIFGLVRSVQLNPENCASKAKNIADTGRKTLTYTGPEGTSSCTYNFTENKNIDALTTIFEGIAETMDQGRHLDFLRRFDRLGLDDAIAVLAQEVTDGRALELGTIAPSLHSIANDTEVMQRVRTRASTLLAQIPPDSPSR